MHVYLTDSGEMMMMMMKSNQTPQCTRTRVWKGAPWSQHAPQSTPQATNTTHTPHDQKQAYELTVAGVAALLGARLAAHAVASPTELVAVDGQVALLPVVQVVQRHLVVVVVGGGCMYANRQAEID